MLPPWTLADDLYRGGHFIAWNFFKEFSVQYLFLTNKFRWNCRRSLTQRVNVILWFVLNSAETYAELNRKLITRVIVPWKMKFSSCRQAPTGYWKWKHANFPKLCCSNMCCPGDCVSRHNGGTSGAPLIQTKTNKIYWYNNSQYRIVPPETIVLSEHYHLRGV